MKGGDYMIRRYTTPYHHFVLPFLTNEIDEVILTYSQNDEIIFTKEKEDVVIHDIDELLDNASMGEDLYALLVSKAGGVEATAESSLLSVHLTQEDTSSFTFYKAEEKNIALAQIRVKDTKGDAFVSRPIKIRVYGSTSEGVI